MMSTITLYHNPNCSKSRATLALLEPLNLPIKVVNYLQTPLNLQELQQLLVYLNQPVQNIIRDTESITDFNQKTNDELLEVLLAQPALLQRPIVVYKEKAMIGRPPESVLELFK